jgi:hypothetical protein
MTSPPFGRMPRFHEYVRLAPLPSKDVKLKAMVVALVVYMGTSTLHNREGTDGCILMDLGRIRSGLW